jgi:hypothetical protein
MVKLLSKKNSKIEVKIAPVLLLGFRRPTEALRVFGQIKKARPSKFFLYVDGARNKDELRQVLLVRDIVQRVDWDCEVKTFFREKNSGIKGCLDAIEWFISEVGEGIILEDDALPTLEFFRFCSELLERYRGDDRIAYINGCNFISESSIEEKDSYYFSKYPTPKGFAIWKSSWRIYDYPMKDYLNFKKSGCLKKIVFDRIERLLLGRLLDDAYVGPDGIDFRWIYSLLTKGKLAITPSKNLVTDIGFGPGAANTREVDSYLSKPTKKIKFPLSHPKFMVLDRTLDAKYFRWLFFKKLKKKILIKGGFYKIFKARFS